MLLSCLDDSNPLSGILSKDGASIFLMNSPIPDAAFSDENESLSIDLARLS